MLICSKENCLCFQHKFMDHVKNRNPKAQIYFEKLENRFELTDTSGSTLLHIAVKYGNPEMTEHLIDNGYEVNAQDNSGVTPLMLAVKASEVRIIEILLKNNADIYATDCHGITSLQLAFNERFYYSTRSFSKHDPRLILEKLFDVVNNDYLQGRLMQFLLNANDLIKFIVMIYGSDEIINFILKNGYSIDFPEPKREFTALMCAFMLGKIENAKLLIDYGANVNVRDKYGHTLLYFYLYHQDMDKDSELLKRLLTLSTIFTSSSKYAKHEVRELLMYGNKNTVRTILLSGIYTDWQIDTEPIPFFLVQNKRPEILDLFDELNIKWDVNRQTEYGSTALMSAATFRCLKSVEFLLHLGADVNLTTYKYGYSALSHVPLICLDNDVEKETAKIVELLLQHGADAQVFCLHRKNDLNWFNLPGKIMIAHLAILGALETPTLTDSTLNVIQSTPRLKNYFDLCLKQLDGLKNFKVNGTVMLFNLLSEREETVMAYARNRELISSWSKAMDNLSDIEVYYSKILQRRLSKIVDEAKLQARAALAIEVLTGLSSDVYNIIVYEIISYLDRQDLHNLSEI